MDVHVNPSYFQRHENGEHITPQINSAKDLEALQKKETEVIIKGDIFSNNSIAFEPMTQEELRNEKIDIKSFNLKQTTTSEKPTDDRTVVVFRDPKDPDKVIAYKLDEKTLEELKKSFDKKDFFQREDGILRLNGKVESYIAGWVSDIKENRGYDKADADGNGTIDDSEQYQLTVGFDHNTDYDYLGEKIATAHSTVGKRTYQKYSDTNDSRNQTNVLNSQSLKFKDSVEKELVHTLNLDKDKDGIITLKEGMKDFTLNGKSVEEHLLDKVKLNHDSWVIHSDIILDNKSIATRDIPQRDIVNEEDRIEAFNQKMKQYRERMALKKSGIDTLQITNVFAGTLDETKKNSIFHSYVDLGEDISQYRDIDAVQNQTNNELINYLSGIIDNSSVEGKKNLEAYDTRQYHAFLNLDAEETTKRLEASLNQMPVMQEEPFTPDRRFSVYGRDGESIRGLNMDEMKEFLGEDYAKNSKDDLETIIERVGLFIYHDFDERQKEFPHGVYEKVDIPPLEFSGEIAFGAPSPMSTDTFQKLYSFSDDFSKTEKFQELYETYESKLIEQSERLSQGKEKYFDVIDTKDYITSNVLDKNFSKAQVIENYTNISNELKAILDFDSTGSYFRENLQKSINLYDKITEDLKDMWGTGGLNIIT